MEAFERIQDNYDCVMLQEELKSMLVENQLLKELVEENQNKFRLIETKREEVINKLQQ